MVTPYKTRSDEASLVSNVHITDPVMENNFAVHCGLALKTSPTFLARKSAIGRQREHKRRHQRLAVDEF